MKSKYYVNGREVSKERLKATFQGGTLCVCSVDKDGTISPLNQLWLDRPEANCLLSWMKLGPSKPDAFQILDMATVDLSKLSFKCYIKECQDKMMNAFKKAQGIPF